MVKLREDLLTDILTQPSAPYRERHVIAVVTKALAASGVPFFNDPVGNIIIGAKNISQLKKKLNTKATAEPLMIFMAHMDHPGFIGSRWLDTKLEVVWHGGSPTKFLDGARVWLADNSGFIGGAEIHSTKLTKSGRCIDSVVLALSPETKSRIMNPKGVYGGFAFRKEAWRDGQHIYTKAADDLVGTFVVTSLAIETKGAKKRTSTGENFLGILTRAEEPGFMGAIGHFELGWYKKAKRQPLFISIETSRTLPGAEIGKGPIVRLGDKFTVFDPNALRVVCDVASKTLPNSHQRRIMDGGTCEATAATAYGFPCIGFSVPLGNYHNQSFEGGPDSRGPMGPAPEFVHISDVSGMLKLCISLLKRGLPWNEPWKRKLTELKKDYKRTLKLMKSGP